MLPTKFWLRGFRGEDLKKSANQKQELPMVAMFVNGSGQNEQYLERTFHRCFLPSFTSFGLEVSEEKIKMWKANGRQTTDANWWQKLKSTSYLVHFTPSDLQILQDFSVSFLLIAGEIHGKTVSKCTKIVVY